MHVNRGVTAFVRYSTIKDRPINVNIQRTTGNDGRRFTVHNRLLAIVALPMIRNDARIYSDIRVACQHTHRRVRTVTFRLAHRHRQDPPLPEQRRTVLTGRRNRLTSQHVPR